MNRRLPTAVLLAALVTVGCTGKAPTTPKASTKPVVGASVPAVTAASLQVSQVGDATQLTGKVKIVSDNGGGIISDNGGGIISDNGGGVISNNSGNLIANNGSGIIGNNGGTIISNDGGGLTGKVKYPLLAVSARELLLADATIAFYDAAGRQLQDETGKPVTVTTDATGNYQLKAVLPPGNLIMKIQVHEGGLLKGGELSAMLVREGSRVVDTVIDTSSSLGAAYVLGQYVKGAQATFDKLPASEAERLRRALDLAGAQLASVPDYHPDKLVAATEALRAKAPGVDKTLKDIQALLLGQASLGNGQLATSVALFRPNSLVVEPDGGIVVGEPTYGRIRRVGPDGTFTTIADVVHGTLKRNFSRLSDLKRGPDGSLYVVDSRYVYRISPDGSKVEDYAGGPDTSTTPLPGPGKDVKLFPTRLAVGADGTVYVAEIAVETDRLPRVVAIDKGGQAREVKLTGFPVTQGWFSGVEVTADGTLYFLYADYKTARYQVLRLKPGGQVEVMAKDLASAEGLSDSGFTVGPDGTVYVCETGPGDVRAIAPDGTQHVVAGVGGPADRTDLLGPRACAFGPDGSLVIVDERGGLVHVLTADGRWFVRAGTTQRNSGLGGLRDISLDSPEGGVFDEQGRLLIGEYGAGKIERLDGGDLVTVAGTVQGDGGDGGPATAAKLNGPTGIARHNGETFFIDGSNHRLRAIAADGTIRTVAGGPGTSIRSLEPGQRVDAKDFQVEGLGIAVDKAGRVYWSGNQAQVYRLAADGKVEIVAGKGHSSALSSNDPAQIAAILDPKQGDGGPAKDAPLGYPTGLAFDAHGDLYIADTVGFRIRKVTDLDGPSPTISTVAGLSYQAMLAVADQDPFKLPPGVKASETVLFCPGGLAFGPDGTLYVGEMGTVAVQLLVPLSGDQIKTIFSGLPSVGGRVRKIAPDGTITTIAGQGGKFFPDPSSPDALVLPAAVALGPDGRLAIVDTGANVVRILPAGQF